MNEASSWFIDAFVTVINFISPLSSKSYHFYSPFHHLASVDNNYFTQSRRWESLWWTHSKWWWREWPRLMIMNELKYDSNCMIIWFYYSYNLISLDRQYSWRLLGVVIKKSLNFFWIMELIYWGTAFDLAKTPEIKNVILNHRDSSSCLFEWNHSLYQMKTFVFI
jgi:hypothetical protein